MTALTIQNLLHFSPAYLQNDFSAALHIKSCKDNRSMQIDWNALHQTMVGNCKLMDSGNMSRSAKVVVFGMEICMTVGVYETR